MTDLYPAPVPGFKLVSAEASNEQIAELIGMPFEVFTSTVVFAQQSRGRTVTDFIDMDDAGQKEVFSSLFNLRIYDETSALVKPIVKRLRAEVLTVESQISSTTQSLTTCQDTCVRLTTSREAFDLNKAVELKRLEDAIVALKPEELQTKQLEYTTLHAVQVARQASASTAHRAAVTAFQEAKKTHAVLQNSIKTLTESVTTQQTRLFPTPGCPEAIVEPVGVQEKANELRTNTQELITGKQAMEYERDNNAGALQRVERELAGAQKRLETARANDAQVKAQREKLTRQFQEVSTCPTCLRTFDKPEDKENALKELKSRIDALQDIDFLGPQTAVELYTAQRADVLARTFDAELYGQVQETILSNDVQLKAWDAEIKAYNDYKVRLARYDTSMQARADSERERDATLQRLETQLQEATTQYEKVDAEVVVAEAAYESATQAADTEVKALHELELAFRQELVGAQQTLMWTQTELAALREKQFTDEKWLTETVTQLEVLEAALQVNQLTLQQTRDLLTVHEDLDEAFSREGILSDLFQEYLPDIQRSAVELLTDLTNGELTVEFSGEKQLKTRKGADGGQATKNEFEIKVSKRNGGQDYDVISGSEKNKAAIVVNWAISDLAYRRSNVSFNVRVFDEVFDAMDPKSMERLGSMIKRKSEQEKQITLVISHNVELEDLFSQKVVLRKEQGVSRLVA